MEEKGTPPTMSAYSFVHVGTVKGQHLGHLQRKGVGSANGANVSARK